MRLTIPQVTRYSLISGRGGIGRRARLRGVWETVWVQVPSTAPSSFAKAGYLLPLFFALQGEFDVNKQHYIRKYN